MIALSTCQSQLNRSKKGPYCTIGIVITLVLGWCLTTHGQEAQTSESTPSKVLLRWKFHPDQVFRGKLAYGLRTYDENLKRTSFVYEYEWHVQSLKDDGSAVVMVVMKRERLRHRSRSENVQYDSQETDPNRRAEIETSEMLPLVEAFRIFHKQENPFIFSGTGHVSTVDEHTIAPMMLVNWPELPEQPVGVGDTWTAPPSGNAATTYKLVKLDNIEGHLVAWIESERDTRRCRFLVDEGRYLDDVYWNILGLKSGTGNVVLQSHSARCRLELVGTRDKFDRWPALQPNQPGRAMDLFQRSYSQTAAIKEYLSDERSLLTRIQHSLFMELADNIDVPAPRPQWTPMDWLLTARYYQRTGDLEKHRQLLIDGAEAVAAILDKTDISRNYFLLQFADQLARIGESDAAKRASQAISPECMTGLNFTETGIVRVPRFAISDYGLFTVAREQARAGHDGDAKSTAGTITEESARCAAYWIVAMELADQGKIQSALECVSLAEKLYVENGSFIEYDTKGPVEARLHAYRTLSLGRVAVNQAIHGDEDGMWKTVAQIDVPAERNAVLVDLIVALDRADLTGLIDKVAKELPELSQGTEIGYRIMLRLQSKKLDGVEEMIESIRESTWKAASRINYFMALKSEAGRTAELDRQLGLAQAAIQEISVPQNRASMAINLASVLIEAGRPDEARKLLITALDTVNRESMKDAERVELQVRIAKGLAGADSDKEFEDVMNSIEAAADRLEDFEKASTALSLVDVCLEKGDLKRGEAIADGIEPPFMRCQALARIGKGLAQQLELEKSREVFGRAYDSAMKVTDATGLDTVGSKGGAIRFIAKEQGGCDLEGLVVYLEEATNPNILAYGWLGGAEALDPAAAEAAVKVGRMPTATLKVVCDSNIACRLLEQRLQPPSENKRAN